MVVICNSAHVQEKHPLNFVAVLHNGIVMSQYRPPGKKRGDYFAWLGRFVPEKGPHLAIEAARQANVPLILAGTMDRYLKASISYFQEQIKPQVNDEQIMYIGPVNMKQKVRLLSRARAFLNPIEWEEPFGMVMIEAMALGCPVISFDRGAASEIVIQGETGFLVQNVAEMVQHIPRIDEINRDALHTYVEQ